MKPIIAMAPRMLIEDGYPKYFINEAYVLKLQKQGAFCFLLMPHDLEQIEAVLPHIDGILIPGGDDMDASYFHETNHPACKPVVSYIDETDLSLIHLARQSAIPLFGICRGLQVINVAYQGTLYQDIPSQLPHAISHRQHGNPHQTHHTIHVCDPALQAILGTTYAVNSFHHQAIHTVGQGLTVAATSEDGIVEAITGPNLLAVQWHPEQLQDEASDALFAYWLKQVKQSHRTKQPA